MNKILVINVGSTSTKLALFENGEELWGESANHDAGELAAYKHAYDQYAMRKQVIKDFLSQHNCKLDELDAVVTRAPLYPVPVSAGAYEVNAAMMDDILNRPAVFHPGNLAAVYVKEIADKYSIPGLAFDSSAEEERLDVTKITGIPEIKRNGKTHTLNMREVAMDFCEKQGIDYFSSTFIIAHMGGGTTLDLHHNGKVIDGVSDDFGPFSPTRMGAVPGYSLVKLALNWKGEEAALMKKLQQESGLFAYFKTTDLREVEKRANSGDKEAQLVLDALCLNIAKSIGSLAVVVAGKIDNIILTGGMAHSQYLTEKIEEKVKFIAPVVVSPGENEMKALANGALRAIRTNTIHTYNSAG